MVKVIKNKVSVVRWSFVPIDLPEVWQAGIFILVTD